MKQIAQSPNRLDFNQQREYHKYLEELEDCQDNENYMKVVNQLLVDCNKELIYAPKIIVGRGIPQGKFWGLEPRFWFKFVILM